MKYKDYGKRLLSLVLVMALVLTTIPSSMFTPVFADDYVQKGRFLVVYEKGAEEETLFSRGVLGIENEEKEIAEIKNGEIISEGKENIALVNDSKLGISSTFKDDKILVIEEDKMVSLFDISEDEEIIIQNISPENEEKQNENSQEAVKDTEENNKASDEQNNTETNVEEENTNQNINDDENNNQEQNDLSENDVEQNIDSNDADDNTENLDSVENEENLENVELENSDAENQIGITENEEQNAQGLSEQNNLESDLTLDENNDVQTQGQELNQSQVEENNNAQNEEENGATTQDENNESSDEQNNTETNVEEENINNDENNNQEQNNSSENDVEQNLDNTAVDDNTENLDSNENEVNNEENKETSETRKIAEIKNSLEKYITDGKGENIKIALIDSGVNTETGITLAGGESFVGGSYDTDENGHGTSLAGIIKGYETVDGIKFEGLAPDAELYSLKILDENGNGYYSDVIKALDWARENNIDVVIMSFGADEYSSVLHRSIQKCYFQDMLLVSASGNKNGAVKYPAAYTEVMAVGSSFNDKTIVYNYENKNLVELYAEGKHIQTINESGQAVFLGGSSYSSAVVATVGASLWSKDRTLNAREVRGFLKNGGKKLNLEEEYILLDAKKTEFLQDNGEIPTAEDYDSEIKDKIDNNAEVSALAKITLPPEDTKMWQTFKVGVKFSDSHEKVVAKLMLLKDGKAIEVDSTPAFNVIGGYDQVTGTYTGKEYHFKFDETYRKGNYRVDFYPYDINGVQQDIWNFQSNEFAILGADLALANFVIASSNDVVLEKENLKGRLEVQNVEKNFYADYPADISVSFYRIEDNNNNFIYPDEESIKTLDTVHFIESKPVSQAQLANGNKVPVEFEWKPENKDEVQNYKIFAVIDYKKEYDDVYTNNIARIACDTTVTLHFPDGSKATLKGDPVDIASGNYTSTTTDMAVAGKMPLEFKRTYNALDFKNIGLGLHFKHNYNIYYEDREDYLKVYFADGHIVFFDKDADGTYEYNKSDYKFVGYKDGKFTIEYKNGKTYYFGGNSYIEKIAEKGNTLNFAYETYFDEEYYNGEKELYRLTDISSVSGEIILTYDADNNLVNIKDNAGRMVEYTHDGKYLSATTNVSGNIYHYQYDDDGRLEKLIDPYGNDQLENVYDSEGRVYQQVNEDGTTYQYEYFDDKTIFTERDGTKSTYYKDEKDRIIKKEYVDGSERFVFDENDNVIRYFDKNGNETGFEYDENGNLVVSKDALGQVTKYIHNQNGDLIEKENPDGTKVTYSYDEHSNLLSITDELGQTESFVYDSEYNLIENVRKDGSVLSFTYDGRGNLKSESLNGTVLNLYEYDLVNRPVKVTDALGNFNSIRYTSSGKVMGTVLADGSSTENIYDKEERLIESIDGNGNHTKYSYNAMGSLSEMVSADGAITKYTYDNMQNLVKTTFADGTEIENIYDNAGRLIKEIDELGNFKTYTYDNNGNILSTTDELGRETSFEYDELNRLIKTTNPLGDVSTLIYRYDNKILSSTDFAGKTTSYDYDALGRVIKVTSPDGYSENITYDSLDNIISSVDKLGRETKYAYDERENLISLTRPDGTVLTNEYDLADNIIHSIDAMGNITSYQYDSLNRLIKTTNALGDSVSLEYDNNSNVVKTTDENGNYTTYVYDSMNRVVEIIDALGQSDRIEYDALGRVIKNINKDGSFSALEYDSKGRLVSNTDELGFSVSYAYDAVGNMIQFTDKEGNITSSSYDELDRLISVTDPLGNITSNTYDKSGNIISVTNAISQTTSFEYDINNKLIKETKNAGTTLNASKEYAYDVMGNLTEFTDPHQNKTLYGYDELDRLVKVTFPDNTFKKQEYDKNGNITAVVDVLGNSKTYTYDALNRLISETDEEGIVKKNTYTKTSKIASSVDGNGNVTSFEYDELGRLTKEINALGTPTTYIYDNRDNIVEIITKTGVNDEIIKNLACSENYKVNERDVSESFEYNTRRELIKEISRLGYEKTYDYDGNGNLVEIFDEDEFNTRFSYDANSNLVEKTITGGLLPELQNSKITYVYDELNRIIKRTDDIYTEKDFNPTREYTYTYDEFGNLASETDFEGKKTSLYYDLAHNLTTLIYPEGTAVEYSYDCMNRVKTVTDKDGVNTYTYDELGRRTRLDFSNGTHEKYAYDKKGRTLSQVTGDKRNVTMTIHDYEYDNNDNIKVDVFKDFKTKHIKDVNVKTYAYDALNQLVTEQEQKDNYEKDGTKTKFYYDLAGNMVQKASYKLQTSSQKIFNIQPKIYTINYKYNEDNQLLSQRGVSEAIAYHKSVAFDYEYDKRGNMTAIKDPWMKCTSKYITQFYYDGMNKMRYSTDKQNRLTRYSYDGEGRRIFKESETILAMTKITSKCDGCRGLLIKDQIKELVGREPEICMGKDFKTTQNFIYNPISEYDDILLTYGKNVHSQRFVYGAKDKDKGLIKVDSYQLYGQLWDENSTGRTYQGLADYHNDNYAKETFRRNAIISTYMIKDIRGSIEQQTGKKGFKGFTYQYTAFGVEKFPMNLNDIHGFAGYVRDRETDSYYANARQYIPQIHRFMAKDKLRVDSLNKYLYVVNNPINLVDPSGLLFKGLKKAVVNAVSSVESAASTVKYACAKGATYVVAPVWGFASGVDADYLRNYVLSELDKDSQKEHQQIKQVARYVLNTKTSDLIKETWASAGEYIRKKQILKRAKGVGIGGAKLVVGVLTAVGSCVGEGASCGALTAAAIPGLIFGINSVSNGFSDIYNSTFGNLEKVGKVNNGRDLTGVLTEKALGSVIKNQESVERYKQNAQFVFDVFDLFYTIHSGAKGVKIISSKSWVLKEFYTMKVGKVYKSQKVYSNSKKIITGVELGLDADSFTQDLVNMKNRVFERVKP